MINKKTKSIGAALLLAFYAFIATPISFWHHHEEKTATEFNHQKIANEQLSFTNSDVVCKICAYQYTTYNAEVLHLPGFIVSRLSFLYNFNSLEVVLSPTQNRFNRGPPANLSF